ncbi:MAG: N-acetylmuramoyl-L-alanine amidase, partial [Chthoniobacterales bacterium]|nr:N-acetylmuramoyl-L-alanine amidase [Chthoniobacterales bacterium]
MSRPRRWDYERRQSIVAWFGLLVMAASFLWLHIVPLGEPGSVGRLPAVRPREQLALVVIDPGHGGEDSGAMASGLLEKDLAFDVAQRLDRLIRSQGLATLLTRAGDEYISLAGRAAAANRARDCIFVSIHFDEARAAATGVETYYAAPQTPDKPIVATWFPFLQPASAARSNVQSQ